MSRSIFQPEWRTKSRRKRRFYARYMGWLEKTGFVVVGLLVAGFASSFFYSVDEWVTAEDVAIEIGPDGEPFVQPKLAGKSIAKAALGQPAEITNIRIQAPGDTLLRAQLSGDASGEAVSRRLAGEAVKKALEESLVGRSIQAREDAPLRVSSVGEIEVEAELHTAASMVMGEPLDPDAETKLTGSVVEGQHVLSAQLGELPPEVRESAIAALRAQLVGKPIEVDGKPQKIEDVLDPRFVVKLNAQSIGDANGALNAASLKRTFDAKIKLTNVPDGLARRMRDAVQQGRQVTAKVQVRTGSRPIAYFLLRRS